MTSSGAITPFNIVVKAGNTFGGFTLTDPIDVYVDNRPPHGVITSPVRDKHLRGVVDVVGSAEAGILGFGGYELDYVSGSDPDAVSGWQTLATSAFPVTINTLGSWDVSGLADGPYVLRMTVDDDLYVFQTVTHVLVEVDNDYAPPTAPATLSITGQLQTGVVANGKLVDVQGTAEAFSSVEEALVVDAATFATLKDVTNDLTIHLNGVVRGTFTLPGGMSANQVGLRLTVRDRLGNVSDVTTSNFLLVDNDAPTVSIHFPQSTATLPEDLIIASGVTADVGVSGGEKVERSEERRVGKEGRSRWSPYH